jgi:hypothetical protein
MRNASGNTWSAWQPDTKCRIVELGLIQLRLFAFNTGGLAQRSALSADRWI